MLTYRMIGSHFAALSGEEDTAGGAVAVLAPHEVASIAVNGRAFPCTGGAVAVPASAFRIGLNGVTLHRKDGQPLLAEKINRIGESFFPAGIELTELISLFDSALGRLDLRVAELEKRLAETASETLAFS